MEAGSRALCQHGLSRRAPLLPGGVVGTPERAEAETWVSASGSGGVVGTPERAEAETWVSASGSGQLVLLVGRVAPLCQQWWLGMRVAYLVIGL
jgi:hypothetical protein